MCFGEQWSKIQKGLTEDFKKRISEVGWESSDYNLHMHMIDSGDHMVLVARAEAKIKI